MLKELVDTLHAFKKPLDPQDILLWEELILARAILVTPTEQVTIIKDDPEDNKFIEAALEAQAPYIISYDKHLLRIKTYREITILKPRDYKATFL